MTTDSSASDHESEAVKDTAGARPAWPFKVPFQFALWLRTGPVTKITHHWKMTGVDTSDNWIELHIGMESRKCPVDISGNYSSEVKFNPDHARLVHLRDDISARIEEIAKWEKRENRDIAQYKRLRKKLYGSPASPLTHPDPVQNADETKE